MRKWMKRAGIGFGMLAAALVIAAGAVYAASEARLNQELEATFSPFRPLGATADAAVLERGRHLSTAIGKCGDCHGPDLGGRVFMDAGPVGTVIASNLTSGKGGVLANYDDAALERAIRHGVRHDGRPLAIMPSNDYYAMSDADVAAVIAHLRTVPPVDRELPATRLGPVGRALLVTGQLPLFPVETMDHAAARPTPAPGVTAEYGEYLATIGGCKGCHGADLTGGIAHAPDDPPSTNLTPAGIGAWTEADFFNALRKGVRPDGSAIDAVMPWASSGRMTDDEIRAVWAYLKTVPAKQTAEQT